MTTVIHGWSTLLYQLSPDQLKKSLRANLSKNKRSVGSVCHPPFIAFSLCCHYVQSLCVSRSWRQRLWCRRLGTVVCGRHGPRMWLQKQPNLLQDAHTPKGLHCHHGNCLHASLAGCYQRRACGLWRHYENAAGSGDGEVRRGAPAVGS